MNSTMNIISNTEKEIEVALSPEEFLGCLDRAANKISKDTEIPGFRKGNAPRDIVEQRVGSSALYDEAAELAVEGTYEKALESAKKPATPELESIGDKYAVPEIKIIKVAPNNPFVYKIILRAPVFKLTEDYLGIAKNIAKKEKKEVSAEEKEINETLDWLAKQKKAKPDDALAKSLGDFKDLEALKKSIKEGIVLEKEKKEKDRIRILIANAIIAKSSAEIPEKVVDREVLKIEEEFTQNISQMGLNFDEYLKKIKKTKEELRAGWRDQAKERIETGLLLDAVAEKKDIEPSDKEIDEETQKVLSRFNNTKEAEKEVDHTRLKSYVRGIIRNEKVFEFLENL